MNRLKLFLEKWGLHAFLLPVFFITHNYQQYYGLVPAAVTVRLGLIIFLLSFFFFIIILAITKHVNKSLQLVTLYGFVLLFFGVIKDFFQFSLHANLLSKYSILLPLIIISIIFFSWIIVRKNDFRKNNLFQNILLLLFLLIDVSRLAVLDNSIFLRKNLLVNKSFETIDSVSVDKKPDIYFLVFDSYPGTSFLNEMMKFDNSPFNQKLEEKGFYVVKNPKSNYNRTAFSIASTLNFSYLENIKPNKHISSKNYAEANLTIKEALVPRFLKDLNYSFYNLSIFDIGNSVPIRKETYLTMPEQNILLYNTLLERLKNDLFWNVLTGKYSITLLQKFLTQSRDEFQKQQEEKNIFNERALDSLFKIPYQKVSSPKFIYTHFYLPHPPFFYNEHGKRNDPNYIMTEASLENKDLFLSYLKYTNRIILGIINAIQSASGNKSIIIIQSDHGFRDFAGWQNHPECFFMNYSAIYFPDKDYSALYDTMSNVNTFPIIFNKYFKTMIPLEKDSTIFLNN